MQVVEAIYDKGKVTLIKPYKEIKQTTKVVVCFMDKEEALADQEKIITLAKLQESTGFVTEVLGNSAEDVWNDI